jgi:arsenate reductase (glutaredoxin)
MQQRLTIIATANRTEDDMKVTIWHNPGCGTSRKTLEILNATPGIIIEIIEYKKTPFTRHKLIQLFAAAGITAKDALRVRGTNAEEMGLTAASVTNDQILDAMAADPMLVERPFVETEKGVALCRPQDKVRDIL